MTTARKRRQPSNATWRRYFSPRLAPIHADGSLAETPPAASLKPTIYVLSRAVCSFSRVRIAAKNAKARAAAKLGVAFRQGYADPQTRLVRDPDDPLQAGVWSWDGDLQMETGETAAGVRLLPETFAREGFDDGARILRCIDGYEGQVWRNKALIASRWWPKTPTDRDWQQFLRAAQASTGLETLHAPEPVDAPFRNDLPLVDPDPASLKITFAPARVAAVAATFLILLASFQASQYLTHKSVAASRSAQIEETLSDNSAAIQARSAALTAASQIEELAEIGDAKPAALAFVAVASEIPRESGRIANFRIYDQQIEARISTTAETELDIPDLVSRLEKNTILNNVFAERRNARTIGVSAEIAAIEAPSADAVELRE